MALRRDGLAAAPASPRLPRTTRLRFALHGSQRMRMSKPVTGAEHVTTEKLMDDLRTVVGDAEELLKATASQTGERIAAVRAKAERNR